MDGPLLYGPYPSLPVAICVCTVGLYICRNFAGANFCRCTAWHNVTYWIVTYRLALYKTEQIACRRIAAFVQVARLSDNVPARLALHCQIDSSLGRLPSNTCNKNVVLVAQGNR